MPFPSTGCKTCKIRRIKCDETQPVCQRCAKSQRSCYGMRAGHEGSIIHSENPYASGQKNRPRGPRSSSTVEPPGSLNTAPHGIFVDLKTQAITYYLQYHLRTLADGPSICKGVSDDILPLWMARADCPLLELAVSSMALAVFSRTQHHPPAAIEASLNYHRLLRVAQVTISSLDKGNIDACLLAIFFMGRYEQVAWRPSHPNQRFPITSAFQIYSHHDGVLAILKNWKDRLSYIHIPTDIIKYSRRGMIRSAILRSLALPLWMVDGASFGEQGLELEYDCIIVRIVQIRHRLSTLPQEMTNPQYTSDQLASIIEELNEEARNIDRALQDWAFHFPSIWQYQPHTLSTFHSWHLNDFYSPTIYSYSRPAYAAVWNQYYSTRMLITSTRLRLLELSHPISGDFAAERSECLFHINTMGNDLASSIPFCLERFKITDSPDLSSNEGSITLNTKKDIKPYVAGLVVWPLTIASRLEDVDVTQRMWFTSQLARLGGLIGDSVLECTETNQWL